MSDFGDDALSRQERDLADILAARRASALAPAPTSDSCASCAAVIEPARRQALPKTNICGACATALNGGKV